MDWLIDLVRGVSPAQAVERVRGASPAPAGATAVLPVRSVPGSGIARGSNRVLGISLGIRGVLFAGLFPRHPLGRHDRRLDTRVLDFAGHLGLILFVYAI